jgi:palmitoyltransferase ZDHHC6
LASCILRLLHSKKTSAELLFTAIHASWPPQNPTYSSDGPDDALTLPDSPWTYENGSLNPTLEPSNARLRSVAAVVKKRKRQVQDQNPGKSSLPPYHPDYDGVSVMDTLEDGNSTSEDSEDTPFVRGGSEGYEVQSVDREDLMRRYLMEVGQEPGRYHRYIPSPDSDSDEERLPLAQELKDSQ